MTYDFKNKIGNIQNLNNYMLAKTLSMFEYENLPESIPYRELEYLLQTNGYAFITKVGGELYALNGSIGGEVDVYNKPTKITINNVALKFNKTLDIKKDGVLISNDDMFMGLIPLYEKHHSIMVENDINMVIHGFNSRMQKLISASDDRTKESAQLYVKKAIDGEIAIIGENAIFEGVKVHSGSNNQSISITSMIEFNQYLKATLYNEMGLSANFNMKRERLISSEVEAGEDSLFPFVYNMMKCRLNGIEKINTMFDLDVKIDFGSVWHLKNKELVDDHIDPNKLPNEAKQTKIETNLKDETNMKKYDDLDPITKEVSEVLDELENSENGENDLEIFSELGKELILKLEDLINSDDVLETDINHYKSLIDELKGAIYA